MPSNPFNSPFGAGVLQGLPLSVFAGRPGIGVGASGKSQHIGGGMVSSVVFTDINASSSSSGPVFTSTADVASGGYDASAVVGSTVRTAKEYSEYKLVALAGASTQYAFGGADGRNTPPIAGGSPGGGLKVSATTAGAWTVNSHPWGNSFHTAVNYTTPPAADDIIGLAIDWTNARMYAHVNGTWLTDGASGGDPSGGLGWTFFTSGTIGQWLVFVGTGLTGVEIDAQDAASSVHLPAGYDPLT